VVGAKTYAATTWASRSVVSRSPSRGTQDWKPSVAVELVLRTRRL
jgi:hypothetical protein